MFSILFIFSFLFFVKLKRVILYNHHRNLLPIIADNKNDYYCINLIVLWKSTYIFQRIINYKYRKIVFYSLLRLIDPVYIFDVHWISDVSKICWFYDKKYGNKKKFIVVQHGVYTGGYIKRTFDENRPYTNNFWVWSDYYKNEFTQIFYERKSKVNLIVKGNPIYNKVYRENLTYFLPLTIQNVLIAPTALNKEYALCFIDLIHKLENLKINVRLKFHNYQELSYFKEFHHLIVPQNFSDTMKELQIDAVICDISTLLLDKVCLKKNIIYFQPIINVQKFESKTVYDEKLKNLFFEYKRNDFNRDTLLNLIDPIKQELLFENLVSMSSNKLTNESF